MESRSRQKCEEKISSKYQSCGSAFIFADADPDPAVYLNADPAAF